VQLSDAYVDNTTVRVQQRQKDVDWETKVLAVLAHDLERIRGLNINYVSFCPIYLR
jgi:hypothetical protein